jgi:hypothetical protein
MAAHPNATLKALLAGVLDRAEKDNRQADTEAMREALKLCETERMVHIGIDVQLRGALDLIRAGNTEDASKYIERALRMLRIWSGQEAAAEPA